jgi:proline dehydrogenase
VLRALFISLSESRSLRAIAEKSAIGRRISTRFVAGTQVEDVLRATKAINQAGATVSIDNLGENVTNLEEARESAGLYHQLLDDIARLGLKANISLKLTHMGLDIDEKLARELVAGLVAKAASLKSFVRVDMEGSPYTQRTLDFVHELHRMPGNRGVVGTVIQSYLHRSEQDVNDLLAQGIRIRLCKGAYKEPPEIAFQKKSEVDANYVKLMKILMKSGIYHGLATHDEAIIKRRKPSLRARRSRGIRLNFRCCTESAAICNSNLVREGWGMRVYIPFGTEWYPYFMRRLAERPANVFFIVKNFFRA